MDAATSVWVGLSIAAPVTLVPSIALLRVLHSSRVSWRPLDILFVTLLVAQVAATLLTLGFSATTLLRSAGLLDTLLTGGIKTPLCATLVSSWSAAHTLHATTLASVAVDRLLSIRWPYKYRLSVRRTQVRYHVVVLSIISVLVGVATLFAGSNGVSSDSCVLLPHLLDTRFALFFACLHGALLVTTLAATLAILVTGIMIRCCGSDMIGSGSDLRTLGTISDASATSGTLTTQVARYSGSTPVASLTRATSTETSGPTKTRIEVSGRNRNRHYTVAAVLVVSYVTYHLPILALTIIGSSFDWILPEWPYPATVLGLGLIQSILTMVALVSVDPFIQAWIRESLSRPMTPSEKKFPGLQSRPSSLSCEDLTLQPSLSTLKIDEERKFRIGLYSQDTTEVKFPLTNGSLFAHLASPPPTDGARVRRTSRLGICSLPSPTGAEPPSLSTFQSRPPPAPRMEPLYSDPLPSLQTSFSNHTTRAQFSEPIYATLSETLSSLHKVSLQEAEDFGDSATESAGEDFEFHDIRSSRQTLALEDVDSKPQVKLNRSATYKVSCSVTSAPQISCTNGVTCVKLEFPAVDPERVEDLMLKRSKLVTSLSMNDIDTVGAEEADTLGGPAVPPTFETKFQLIHSSQLDLSVRSASVQHGPPFRQKSIDRTRIHKLHVSLDALHRALNDHPHRSFLDTGDLDPLKEVDREKTVFVSEYL